MPWPPFPALLAYIALLTPAIAVAAGDAPVVNLTYQGVTNPGEFAFTFADRGAFTKPAGLMRFDLAPGALPAGGVGPAQVGYCCDPLTPIVAERTYPFAVESLTLPKHYGLPDDFEGRKRADRRVVALKELYGRNYQAVLDDPAKLNAAFQVAVWEVIQEPDLPGGLAPNYDLFGGQFKSSAKNLESAPAFVQDAQKFVTALNGDESRFGSVDSLRRMDLVRLTGVAGADGIAAQSQIALVPSQASISGGSLAAVGPGFAPGLPALGGGSNGGLGGGSGFPAFAPLGFGRGGGGRGQQGGVGGPVRSSPLLTPGLVPVPTVPPESLDATFVSPGGRSPQIVESPPTVMPPATMPPDWPVGGPPPIQNPPPLENPPDGLPPRDNPPASFGPPPESPPPGDIPPPAAPPPSGPPAVPTPPALLLALLGVGIVAARRLRQGR